MKKVISILFCMVMVFSLFPVINAGAYEYHQLRMPGPNYVTLTANGGYWYSRFVPEETGVYNIYSVGYSDSFIYIYDDVFSQTPTVLAYDDDSGVNNNFNTFVTLEAGEVYEFVISSYFDTYDSFDVYFEKIDADAFEQLQLDENRLVTLDDDVRREFFKFIPEEDGYYSFSSDYKDDYIYPYEDPYVILYDEDFNIIDEDNDTGADVNCWLSCYLIKDQTYYIEATRFKRSRDLRYDFVVKKSEVVVKTEVISEPDNMRYFEGFVEETVDYSGLELRFTYSDGTKVDWKYDDNEEIVGTSVDIMLLKDDAEEYYIYILAGFSDCSIYPDVVEFPVESIEVYSMSKIELYENISGYKKYDGYPDRWDYIYRYEIPQDTMIQINYTDGTSKIVNYYDKVDSRNFTCYDEQLTNGDNDVYKPWSFGENPITIEYYGKETTIYADVVENPVEKLTLNSAPTREYVMWSGSYGGMVDDKYNFRPYDLTGLSFTAHYKDGTTRTFTDADVENEVHLDGYRYDIDWMTISKGGTYQATFTYFEHQLTYDVFVYDKIEPKGDIDMDGKVTIMDATEIQRHLAKLVTLNEAQIKACNVYYDGFTDIKDVTHLQRYLARIITKL